MRRQKLDTPPRNWIKPTDRSPNQCIFCKNKATSKEHFWPDWLKADIGSNNNVSSIFVSQAEGFVASKRKSNYPHRQTLKVLCEPCNNEWGSALQERAKPTIKKLMKSDWDTLATEEIDSLVAWATAFAMVVPFRNKNAFSTSQSTREAFRNNGALPGWHEIMCAAYGTGIWSYTHQQYGQQIRVPSGQHTLIGLFGLQTVTLGVGHLIVNVATIDMLVPTIVKTSIEVGPIPQIRLGQLHPLTKPLRRADLDVASDQDAQLLAWRLTPPADRSLNIPLGLTETDLHTIKTGNE